MGRVLNKAVRERNGVERWMRKDGGQSCRREEG